MSARVCSCCGRPLPDAVEEALRLSGIWFSQPLGRVLLRLAASAGDFVSYETLMDVAYGMDPNGGPDSGFDSVKVALCRYRHRLARQNLAVETQCGFGWRIVWINPPMRQAEAA
ncbi:MAG: hypothetical protein AAGF48_12980 [Pseudomonadota bacterium]